MGGAPSFVLAVNGGSSSIKFALFDLDTLAPVLERTQPASAGVAPRTVVQGIIAAAGPQLRGAPLGAIVHRIVHGGERFDRSQRITPDLLDGLRELIPLAPNHLPDEIALIEAFAAERPQVPQVACFDTAFHRRSPGDQPHAARAGGVRAAALRIPRPLLRVPACPSSKPLRPAKRADV